MRVKSLNPWSKSLEPQRSDLFVVDLGEAVDELGFFNTDAIKLDQTHQYFASSVGFPEMIVTPEIVRRDSRPYSMPSWDAPLSPIRITFVHNVAQTKIGDVRRSEIYQLLDIWRSRVRAGRGSMSKEEEVMLDNNFRAPPYRFDITVKMACGYPLQSPSGDPLFIPGIGDEGGGAITTQDALDSDQLVDPNGPALEVSSIYVLKKAWLSSLSLSESSYEGPSIHKINTVFLAEDLLQL